MNKESDARRRWQELARQAETLRNQERDTLRALIEEALGEDAPLQLTDIQPLAEGGWQVVIRPKRSLTPFPAVPGSAPEPPVDITAPERAPADAPDPKPEEGAESGGSETSKKSASSSKAEKPKAGKSTETPAAAAKPEPAPAPQKPAEEEVSLPLPPLPLIGEEDVLDLPGASFPPLMPEPLPAPSLEGSTGEDGAAEESSLPAPPGLEGLPPIPAPASATADRATAENKATPKTETSPDLPPPPHALEPAGETVPQPKKSEPARSSSESPTGPRTLAELLESGDPALRVPPAEMRPNPYLNASIDPQSRAERLARTLVGDIVAYRVDDHRRALAEGPDSLRAEFGEDVDAARAEFLRQVDPDQVDVEVVFRDALNEVIAHGQQVF